MKQNLRSKTRDKCLELSKLILSGIPRQLRISLQCRRYEFDPWVEKIPWRREWLPTQVFLRGEIHGPRNLAGYRPWGCRVRHD